MTCIPPHPRFNVIVIKKRIVRLLILLIYKVRNCNIFFYKQCLNKDIPQRYCEFCLEYYNKAGPNLFACGGSHLQFVKYATLVKCIKHSKCNKIRFPCNTISTLQINRALGFLNIFIEVERPPDNPKAWDPHRLLGRSRKPDRLLSTILQRQIEQPHPAGTTTHRPGWKIGSLGSPEPFLSDAESDPPLHSPQHLLSR